MTSQIALFNALGVAVASDTVITHSQGSSVKTTNNSEKIWLVGPDHLVAVIVSGSMVVNNSHIRSFITEWSRTLSGPLKSITDYPESFVDWLNQNVHLVSEESQINRIQSVVNNHYSFIAQRLHYLLKNTDGRDPADIWAQVVDEAQGHLEELEVLAGSSEDEDAELLKTEKVKFRSLVMKSLKFSDLFQQHREQLFKQGPLLLSRAQNMPGDVELGFIGFGEEDYHAKSVRVRLRGCYGDKWRYQSDEPFGSDGSGFEGSISFFAQSDAIWGFLRGAHTSLVEKAIRHVWDAVYQVIEGDDDVKIANHVTTELRKELSRYQTDQFVEPMLSTIGGLPLTDLASLAESLVGIQATRSAADAGPATVGGFIETLLISRAHGIQWVNRLPGLPK